MKNRGFDKNTYSIWYYVTLAFTMVNMLRVFSLWEFYSSIGPYLRLISVGLTLFLYVLSFSRYSEKVFLVLLTSLFAIIVGVSSDRLYFTWSTFVLVLGAKGVDFRSILKVFFTVSVCFCLHNVIGSILGMTAHENIYMNNERLGIWGENVKRNSFGYGWATDFANHVFYLLLYMWMLFNGKLKVWGYLFYVIVVFFLIITTDCRLAAGCISLIVLFSLYNHYLTVSNRKISKFFIWFMILSVPLFSLISIFTTMAYDSTDNSWFIINLLLSGRLSLGLNAINDYGISWFGQPTEFYGAIDSVSREEYNYVDCSYILFLLRYGIFSLILLVLLFSAIAFQASKRKDNILLFGVFVVGLSGVISQFLFDIKFCVLLLAFMASHRQNKKTKEYNNSINTCKGRRYIVPSI